MRYEDGALEIAADMIKNLGQDPFAESWRGQSASAFLTALKG